jgi:hypothetical protein
MCTLRSSQGTVRSSQGTKGWSLPYCEKKEQPRLTQLVSYESVDFAVSRTILADDPLQRHCRPLPFAVDAESLGFHLMNHQSSELSVLVEGERVISFSSCKLECLAVRLAEATLFPKVNLTRSFGFSWAFPDVWLPSSVLLLTVGLTRASSALICFLGGGS